MKPLTSALVEITDVSCPGIQFSLFAVLCTDPNQALIIIMLWEDTSSPTAYTQLQLLSHPVTSYTHWARSGRSSSELLYTLISIPDATSCHTFMIRRLFCMSICHRGTYRRGIIGWCAEKWSSENILLPPPLLLPRDIARNVWRVVI